MAELQLITTDEAIASLRAIVNQYGPDHVYKVCGAEVPDDASDCRYVSEKGEPDCLVAKALHRLGVPVSTLKLWEGTNAGVMSPLNANLSGPSREPLVTPEAAWVLQSAQSVQDGGGTWGKALEHAINSRKWWVDRQQAINATEGTSAAV